MNNIERGIGRGYIDDENNLKILYIDEGIWVKVIALTDDRRRGIGVVQNNTIEGSVTWGEFIEFESDNPDEIPKFKQKVSRIPNDENWTTKF
jgi:hypothetical protein